MITSKSVLRALPESTRRVFEHLRHAQGIDKFLLIGGTALALRLHHRLSEDLDFVTTGKMDRQAVVSILSELHRSGCTIKKIVKLDSALEFDALGADVEDYGQDWRVDGVKLTFFSKRLSDPAHQQAYERHLVAGPVAGVECGLIRVATQACIFAQKAQVLSERLLSRDLFDLKSMMETGRHTIADLLQVAASMGADPEITKERLVQGRLRSDDPPVNAIDGTVPDIGMVRLWLAQQVNEYERSLAMAAGQNRGSS